jgi:predicted metal-dependent hydrolase
MILTNVSVFFALFLLYIAYNNYRKNQDISSEIADIDNQAYIVSNDEMKRDKANILAFINQCILKLIDSIRDDNNHHIKKLSDRYSQETLIENVDKKEYKAYSLNKGERIALCLENKDGSLIKDTNLLLFVTIHELAHIMSDSIGHTKEFWDHMRFLLEEAEKLSLYKPVNYKKEPINYCGMDVTSTPYIFK